MSYIVIQEKSHIQRKLPENFQEKDKLLFDRELNRNLPPLQYRVLRNGFVLKDILFTFKPPFFYFSLCQRHSFSWKRLKKRLQMLIFRGKIETEAIWVIDNWSEAYFHWICDALCRYTILTDNISSKTIILPERFKKIKYIAESLSILNIAVIYFDESRKVKLKKLIVPAHTAPPGNFNPAVLQNLRTKFLQHINKTNRKRRIYISRSKAPKRKVTNENELTAVFKKYNIELIHFEDLSMMEQIQVCSEVELIVGLHGAGLTNMLFMQENSAVLELRNNDDRTNNCFFSMSSALNLNYFYLQNSGDSNDTHVANIVVNPDELERTLCTIVEFQHKNEQ